MTAKDAPSVTLRFISGFDSQNPMYALWLGTMTLIQACCQQPAIFTLQMSEKSPVLLIQSYDTKSVSIPVL
jgi:hypothetical protein